MTTLKKEPKIKPTTPLATTTRTVAWRMCAMGWRLYPAPQQTLGQRPILARSDIHGPDIGSNMVRKQRGRVCWGTDAVVDLLGVGSTGMEVPGPNGRTGGRGMSEQTRDARRLAEQRGLRFVDLAKSVVSKSAASLLPESLARRHHVVPIGQQM